MAGCFDLENVETSPVTNVLSVTKRRETVKQKIQMPCICMQMRMYYYSSIIYVDAQRGDIM